MAMIGRWGILLWAVLLAGPLWAGSLTGELDKAVGTVEDQYVYTLTAAGEVEGNPVFPEVDGLEIESAGTSTNVSWINGRKSSEVAYNWLITPTREGTFAIPALQLKVDGVLQQTLPLRLEVGKAKAPTAGISPPIFLEWTLDDQNLVVGGQTMSLLKVFSRVPISRAELNNPFSDAFKVVEFQGNKQYRKVINGHQYVVQEIRRVIVPRKPGSFKPGPYRLTALIPDENRNQRRNRQDLFRGFFDQTPRVRKRIVANPVSLEVRPLPVAGRPADFSGLVGQFRLEATFNRSVLKTGETTTLTVNVRGRGSILGVRPPVVEFGDGVKVYPDKPEIVEEVDRQDGIVGRAAFRYALVPTRAGELKSPPVRLVYFDPQKDSYETLTADPGLLSVRQGEKVQAVSAGGAVPGQQEVRILNTDLIGIHRGDRLEDNHRPGDGEVRLMAGMTGAGVAMLLFSGLWTVLRRDPESGRIRRRRGGALKGFRRSCAEAERSLGAGDGAAAAAALQDGLRLWIGDTFDQRGESVTVSDVQRQLAEKGVEEDVRRRCAELMSAFDQIRYGQGEADPEKIRGMMADLKQLIRELEELC